MRTTTPTVRCRFELPDGTAYHRSDVDNLARELVGHRLEWGGPFPNRGKLVAFNKAGLLSVPAVISIEPKEDAAGNCIVCGEAGRCPGVHAFSLEPNPQPTH